MSVKSCEKVEKSQVALTIEVGAAEFEAAIEKAYQKMRKKINVPGFRPGKAPRKIIEGMYGAEVFFEEAINNAFPEAYEAAVKEQELRVVGYPTVEMVGECTKDGFTFKATTPVYPEVTLGQYKGLEVEKAEATVTDEEVEAELDRMAKNVAGTETVERPAENGDTANIDFEGFDNGVPFEGGKGENYDLVLGSGSFIPGFEEQVVGMSAGEEKDIDVTFPESYHAEALAGKSVVFHVKVNKVTVQLVPEKDDEFAKDVSEFETLEDLKADIREKQLAERAKSIQNAFDNAAVEKAADNATVDMPAALVDMELDQKLQEFAYQLQNGGMSLEQYAKMMGGDLDTMRRAFRPGAEKQAKVNVVLGQIIKEENLEVSEEEVEAEYKSLAEAYDMEVEKVKTFVTAEGMKEDLLTRKAVKVITESAIPVAPKAAETKTEE